MMVSMATASNPKIWNKKFGILIIFYRHHNNRLEIFFFIVFFFVFLNIKFNEKEIWFNIYKLIRFIFPIGIRVSTSWECSIYVCIQVVCMCVCVNRVTCVLYNPNHLFKCPSSVPPWVFDAEPFEFFEAFGRVELEREIDRAQQPLESWKSLLIGRFDDECYVYMY